MLHREHFERLLRNKERELQREMARLEEAARDSGKPDTGDLADAATTSEARAATVRDASVASETLIQVRDALRRIEDNTYGKCILCGRPIEEARLEAIPWTPYCLEDQERLDRAAGMPRDTPTL